LETGVAFLSVFAELSCETFWSARSLLAGGSLVAGWAGRADYARLVWDSAGKNASVFAGITVLSIVTVLTNFTIVSWWSSRSGWSLLATAACGRSLRRHNWAIATGLLLTAAVWAGWWTGRSSRARWSSWATGWVLTLSTNANLLLVKDGHFSPHITGAGLAELRLGDQMALEVGHIAVEHGQSHDRGDHCGGGDDDGEERHSSHLAVLVRLLTDIFIDYRLF